MRERCHHPRVRFARPHYAPGLESSTYQPLLPPGVLALPHVAGVTQDMFRRAGPQLAAELERWRSGRTPLHAVNSPRSPRGLYSRSIDESRRVA